MVLGYVRRICSRSSGIAGNVATENRVDSIVDRATSRRSLTMLERTKEALFHGSREGMHERMCTHSRPIVNRTNIISLVGRGAPSLCSTLAQTLVRREALGTRMNSYQKQIYLKSNKVKPLLQTMPSSSSPISAVGIWWTLTQARSHPLTRS